jgi:serine/threonine protein kinase
MEYVAGVPFDRFLEAAPGAPSDPRRLRKATLQLCEGVHAMHEAGAIHRPVAR